MSSQQIQEKETLAMLAETLDYIETLVSGIDPSALYTKPSVDAWSMNEILAHLRACSDVWEKSITRMLNEDNPTMRYVSPRTHMKKTNYAQQAFHDSLEIFQGQRNMLLAVLKVLSIDEWLRRGTFTGTTRGKHQTVYSYARRIAEHEHHHFSQMSRVLQVVSKP